MKLSPDDPVAAIAESEATGETADIYADIRASIGVPVVNLIWRHLATIPGALAWSWQCLKPHYGTGLIVSEAAELRRSLEFPVRPGLSGPCLAAAGLSGGDLARIDMILRSYELSNAMNEVALAALLARMDGALSDSPPSAPVPHAREVIDGEMPELLALDAMTPPVRALVEDLWAIGGRDVILPSMYRHLAHWPAYLALIHDVLAPVAREGMLQPLIDQVVLSGRHRGVRINAGLASPMVALEPDAQAQLRSALELFVKGPIAKMITIVGVIRRATPNRPMAMNGPT